MRTTTIGAAWRNLVAVLRDVLTDVLSAWVRMVRYSFIGIQPIPKSKLEAGKYSHRQLRLYDAPLYLAFASVGLLLASTILSLHDANASKHFGIIHGLGLGAAVIAFGLCVARGRCRVAEDEDNEDSEGSGTE